MFMYGKINLKTFKEELLKLYKDFLKPLKLLILFRKLFQLLIALGKKYKSSLLQFIYLNTSLLL